VRDDNTEGDGTTEDLDGRHPAAPAARPTPLKGSVPWLRVAIEGVVIVSSILLAFGIDAWWASRDDRVQEQVHLRRLEADLNALQAELLAVNSQAVRDAALFMDLVAEVPEATARDAIEIGRRISPRLVYYHLYTPRLPTYSEMIATGALSLLTSDSVRTALSRYAAAAARTEEWNRWAEHETTTSMQPYVVSHMPYLPHRGDGPAARSRAEPAAWVDDHRFWTLATMRIETDREMIADRDSLLLTTKALLRTVQQARKR
jgi:hypothetical protein